MRDEGCGSALGEALHRADVGRLGQKFQFVEELLGLPRVLIVPDDGDQHGALAAVGRKRSVSRRIVLVLFQNCLCHQTFMLQTRCYE